MKIEFGDAKLCQNSWGWWVAGPEKCGHDRLGVSSTSLGSWPVLDGSARLHHHVRTWRFAAMSVGSADRRE